MQKARVRDVVRHPPRLVRSVPGVLVPLSSARVRNGRKGPGGELDVSVRVQLSEERSLERRGEVARGWGGGRLPARLGGLLLRGRVGAADLRRPHESR